MKLRIALPDVVSPSYFPLIAAVELGHCRAEGLDAEIVSLHPVGKALRALADGEVQYAGVAAHAAPNVFDGWRGCRLLGAISQGVPWLLVVDRRVPGERGDLQAVRGLRIAAASGPADALKALLRDAGIDPDADVRIGPLADGESAPAADGAAAGDSGQDAFGVAASLALQRGDIDGFWANGMGAELALRAGAGRLLLDARRDGPAATPADTFSALLTTDAPEREAELTAMTRALVAAQRALADDVSLADAAARPHFPARERGLIADLVRRDIPFYDPVVDPPAFAAVNRFAARLRPAGSAPLPYEAVIPAAARAAWGG